MDLLTKYAIIIPCKMGDKTLTAAETAQLFFTHIVRYFEVPLTITSETDSHFVAQF